MKSKILKKLTHGELKIAWLFWLFPIFAFVLTGALYYRYLEARGPQLKIHFTDAAGIEVEKTQVRFRGVTVGKVESIELTPDVKGVIAIIRLDRSAKNLAVEGSDFFIVQPQIDYRGIRGLETILSGSYIRIDLGKGKSKFEFEGKTEGTNTDPNELVIRYFLSTEAVESIGLGDSVNYRGMKIGSVTNISFSKGGQSIKVEIGIEKKFVRYIRENTFFWQSAGIEANLGLFGSKIKVGSLESIIKGAINIATPDPAGKMALAEAQFSLLKSAPKDFEKWAPNLLGYSSEPAP